MGKKKLARLGKGVPDIAFRFGAKKKEKKTFRGNQQSCWRKIQIKVCCVRLSTKFSEINFEGLSLLLLSHGFGHTPGTT